MSSSERLRWAARRLRVMEPAELGLHVRRAVAARIDAAAWSAPGRVWARRWEPPDAAILRDEVGRTPLGPLRPGRAALLVEHRPDAVAEVVARSDLRLDGTVAVFGLAPFALPPDWDGLTDPLTGRRWPDRHGLLIDFRHGAPGNPKLVWELHRNQHLPLLVLAGQLTADDRYARSAVAEMLRWIARHPPGRGIPWANAFEPGLRAISLAVAFDGLRGASSLPDAAARTILRSLWQHARWIEGRLSRYSSANNHLIGELVGMLAIGLLAPELRSAPRWRDRAARELDREASLQILGDGASAEQSFAYGLTVVDHLLVAASLFRACDVAVPDGIDAALRRAGAGLSLLVDGDEPDPVYGDDDDGRVLLVDGAERRGSRAVESGIRAFCRVGRATAGEGPDPVALVLFGEDALLEPAGAGERRGSGVLVDAGIVVLRFDGIRAIFDAGPLGYLGIAAHGHADALSVSLSLGSREIVVDPGTGSYVDPGRRAWFRGTPAHATVTVDGADQSEQGGPFLWLRHASSRLLSWDPSAPLAVAEHDGYAALPDPVTHRRLVARVGGGLLVLDRLCGRAPHVAVQTWPLEPSLRPERVDDRLVRVDLGDGQVVWIALAALPGSSVSLDRAGSWSRRLETWADAPRCLQTVAFEGTAVLGAFLVTGATAATPSLVVGRGPDGALEVTCRDGSGPDRTLSLPEGLVGGLPTPAPGSATPTRGTRR